MSFRMIEFLMGQYDKLLVMDTRVFRVMTNCHSMDYMKIYMQIYAIYSILVEQNRFSSTCERNLN